MSDKLKDTETSATEKPRSRALWIFWKAGPGLFLVLMIILVLGLMAMIKTEQQELEKKRAKEIKAKRPAVNVVLLQTKQSSVRDRLDLPGEVLAWESVDISAEVGARVVSLEKSEGSRVNKGDVLVRLDKRDYENAVNSLEALYRLAEKNLGRISTLYEENSIALVELDKAEAEKSRLAAELENARLRLERCDITAPIAGYVNSLPAREGELLNAGDPVASLLDISRVKVAIGVPEADVDEVRALQDFSVHISALGDKVFTGTRKFLSRAPETLAHLYKLEIEVKNPTGKILPGMFARVDIVKRTISDSVVVPLYAVVTRGGDRYVFVEHEGSALRRQVELGVLEGWNVQIKSGVEPGERVVVVGHRSIDEGQTLNVVRTVEDPAELTR